VDFSKRFHLFVALPLLSMTVSACSGGGTGSLPAAPAAPLAAAAAGTAMADAPGMTNSATSASGEMALSADSVPGDHDANNNFIDSIGVNAKFHFFNNVYANYGAVKSALLGLGVRHIRDAFSTDGLNNYENNLSDLANNGIHSTLYLSIEAGMTNVERVVGGGAQAASSLQAGHFTNSVEALEGVNEPDVNQHEYTMPPPAGWVAVTRNEQQALYAGVAALKAPAKRVPVFGPSVKVLASDLQQVGDLSAYMDYGNVHDYSGGYDPTAGSFAGTLSTEAIMSGSKPVVATENGYSSGSAGQAIPNLIMLDYAQRLFYKQFEHGIKRTHWYEFVDESATANDYWNNTGLLTSTYAPKLAYVGLKNVIALLKDQTPYKPRTALNVSFGGQTQFENIEHLLLQKNDGSFWLVVWRDVSEWTPGSSASAPGSVPNPAPTPVANSMNFIGTYVSSISEYDEDYTGTMSGKTVPVSNGNSAQITVDPRPKVFKIVPGVAPAAPATPVVVSPAAHWALDAGSGFVGADSVSAAGNLTVPNNTNAVWLPGRYGTALGFSETEATTSAVPIDTSKSYSASAWVLLNNVSGYQAAVAVNGAAQAAFALDFTPGSNLSYTTYTADSASTGETRLGSSIVPVPGKWYAVAATYDATKRAMSFYVNGALQSTATAKSVFRATGGTELGSMLQGGIGHWQFWNGGVDEVNLYARTLTATEVRTLAGL
jgi:hypothetical protein